jgi:hypothetical protein
MHSVRSRTLSAFFTRAPAGRSGGYDAGEAEALTEPAATLGRHLPNQVVELVEVLLVEGNPVPVDTAAELLGHPDLVLDAPGELDGLRRRELLGGGNPGLHPGDEPATSTTEASIHPVGVEGETGRSRFRGVEHLRLVEFVGAVVLPVGEVQVDVLTDGDFDLHLTLHVGSFDLVVKCVHLVHDVNVGLSGDNGGVVQYCRGHAETPSSLKCCNNGWVLRPCCTTFPFRGSIKIIYDSGVSPKWLTISMYIFPKQLSQGNNNNLHNTK